MEKYGGVLTTFAGNKDTGEEAVNCLAQFVSRGMTNFLPVLEDYCKVVIAHDREDLLAKLAAVMGEFLSPMIGEIIEYAVSHASVASALGRHCPLRILLPGMASQLGEDTDLDGLLSLA